MVLILQTPWKMNICSCQSSLSLCVLFFNRILFILTIVAAVANDIACQSKNTLSIVDTDIWEHSTYHFYAAKHVIAGPQWLLELQSIVDSPNPVETLANEHPFLSEQPISVHLFSSRISFILTRVAAVVSVLVCLPEDALSTADMATM